MRVWIVVCLKCDPAMNRWLIHGVPHLSPGVSRDGLKYPPSLCKVISSRMWMDGNGYHKKCFIMKPVCFCWHLKLFPSALNNPDYLLYRFSQYVALSLRLMIRKDDSGDGSSKAWRSLPESSQSHKSHDSSTAFTHETGQDTSWSVVRNYQHQLCLNSWRSAILLGFSGQGTLKKQKTKKEHLIVQF